VSHLWKIHINIIHTYSTVHTYIHTFIHCYCSNDVFFFSNIGDVQSIMKLFKLNRLTLIGTVALDGKRAGVSYTMLLCVNPTSKELSISNTIHTMAHKCLSFHIPAGLLYTHTYIHTHIQTYTYIHIYKYENTHIHTYIKHPMNSYYIYTFIHTFIHAYRHAYIHTHTCIYTYIHTYIHTYIGKSELSNIICTNVTPSQESLEVIFFGAALSGIIHTYIHIYTHMHSYIHTYIHTYIYTCIYIHTYIHTCSFT
jgi:hypothetical protein